MSSNKEPEVINLFLAPHTILEVSRENDMAPLYFRREFTPDTINRLVGRGWFRRAAIKVQADGEIIVRRHARDFFNRIGQVLVREITHNGREEIAMHISEDPETIATAFLAANGSVSVPTIDAERIIDELGLFDATDHLEAEI